jgi:hypothetical protein
MREGVSNSDDIQGSEENRSDKQHSTTAGPAMINYTLWDLPLSELSSNKSDIVYLHIIF